MEKTSILPSQADAGRPSPALYQGTGEFLSLREGYFMKIWLNFTAAICPRDEVLAQTGLTATSPQWLQVVGRHVLATVRRSRSWCNYHLRLPAVQKTDVDYSIPQQSR